ncbi:MULTISPECIES: LPS export ABC transporter permease LptF [unclassified Psychrobacter]|uniref:LPS export ABC transporter permease LptF n=1 Tax=unclassified Psychrobacter TaxID=196806 RepID=UPI0025B5D696|nr:MULTISPECIES: LPS export ABC transporter permease LptF [unclassified Psychrobacter]MDN3452856.1 LPS export ABC transporter permease LptF [Psychrobacter sp. APC 3350]MDN3502555.1 LPS export ABC transporter permease LptF [Psychrobacter sp. 5A.1]
MTRQVASTTALVLGFLMVMMLGGRLIRYFGIAAEGRLDVSLLFTIIGYNLPYFLELILPLAFFIALMLVFGRLYVDQEMAVINASGVSRGKLARLITPLILALFVGEAALSIVGKPWGVRSSEAVWQQQALTSAFDLIRPNEFISSGNYHLYVGSLSDDKKKLQDVILIQSEPASKGSAANSVDANVNTSATATDMNNTIDKETAEQIGISDIPKDIINSGAKNISKDTITLAKRAEQVDTGSSGITQLDLFQGRRYEVGAGSLKYNQVAFDRYRITLTESSQEIITEDNIETQAIGPLWQAATGSAQVDNTNALRAAQGELGYRFALPWLMIIAPMLAVPLAQVRPRQGRWLRLFPSILLFVSCALGIISLKNAVSKDSVSVWAYAWLILGFMALALYMNWGSRVQHRLRFRKPDNRLAAATSNPSVNGMDNQNNSSQGGQS